MLDGNNNWQRTNIYVGAKLIGTYDLVTNASNPSVQTPWLHFHLQDSLGSRRMQVSGMLNNLGQPETDFQNLPFGDQLASFQDPYADQTADDATPFYFTGKERDAESGNDYFGARYYASTMGRFMSPDWSETPQAIPYAHLDNPQSLNLYSYGLNNPLSHVDPNGHCDIDGEHHGGVWCFLHVIGLTQTQHEQANDIRAAFSDWNLVFYDPKGNKISPSGLSDRQAIDIYNQQFGFSNWDGAAAASGLPPGLMRMRLLSQAKDQGLRNIIDNLYRDKSSFGDGGTADAIEYERATGEPVPGTTKFHSQKGQETARALEKAINSGRLDASDKEIATNLLNRLNQALNSQPRP